MYSFQFNHSIIKGLDIVDINVPVAHELIVDDRAISFFNYLKSIETYLVIPSIILCSKTNTIIDGHHRAWALKELGKTKIPVTYIDYDHSDVIPHIDDSITKEIILESAKNKTLLLPKSSYHHIIGSDKELYPLIMISSLFKI
jgi:L-serine kinase (ADP)